MLRRVRGYGGGVSVACGGSRSLKLNSGSLKFGFLKFGGGRGVGGSRLRRLWRLWLGGSGSLKISVGKLGAVGGI